MSSTPGGHPLTRSFLPTSNSRHSLTHIVSTSSTAPVSYRQPAAQAPALSMPPSAVYQNDHFVDFDDDSLNLSVLPLSPDGSFEQPLDEAANMHQGPVDLFSSSISLPNVQSQGSATASSQEDGNSSHRSFSLADLVAKALGFGDSNSDRQYREYLHGLEKMGQGLSEADLLTWIFILACIFFVFTKYMSQIGEIKEFTGLLQDLKIRLGDSFEVTREQSRNIRKVAKGFIIKELRMSYLDLYIDVNDYCKTHAKILMLNNIYGNPNREDILIGVMRRISSGVRNSFREDLRDSISTNCNKCRDLDSFVEFIAHKYRRAGDDGRSINASFKMCIAILRRLSWENRDLLGIEETDGIAEDHDENDALSPITNTINNTPRTVAASDASNEQPRKKRKKPSNKNHGKAAGDARDSNFWAIVNAWFKEKAEQWGKKLTEPGWTRYIDECYENEAVISAEMHGNQFVQGHSGTNFESVNEDIENNTGIAQNGFNPAQQNTSDFGGRLNNLFSAINKF